MKLTLGITLVLLGLVSTSQAFGQEKKLQEELKKFEGTWRPQSIKMAGKDIPATEFEKVVVKFKGNEVHATKPDGGDLKGEIKLDLNSTPALIDFTTEMDGNRVTLEGIYKFEKGKLIVCVNLNPTAKARPAEFESREGSTTVLEVLRRSKE